MTFHFRRDQLSVYVLGVMLAAILLGLAAARAPVAGMMAIGMAGMMHVMGKQVLCLVMAALVAGLFLLPGAWGSPAYSATLVLMAVAAAIPRRLIPLLLRTPRWFWAVVVVFNTALFCALVEIEPDAPALLPLLATACISSFAIGTSIARNLATTDARMLAWGDDNLGAVTRDLLLGRITSGMLHDLSQPLNVISMANGNMKHVIECLDIDAENRQQLLDRVDRIAGQTQGASDILGLFRSFGRNVEREISQQTVKAALERAVAASRSNIRHHGVTVEMCGNALSYALPQRNGALQMMAVGALLGAFATLRPSREKSRTGKVTINANLSPAHVVIGIQCFMPDGSPVRNLLLDNATLWLVEQVAYEARGSFQSVTHRKDGVCFLIRLGRDDI